MKKRYYIFLLLLFVFILFRVLTFELEIVQKDSYNKISYQPFTEIVDEPGDLVILDKIINSQEDAENVFSDLIQSEKLLFVLLYNDDIEVAFDIDSNAYILFYNGNLFTRGVFATIFKGTNEMYLLDTKF